MKKLIERIDIAVGIIILVGFLVYFNSFKNEFVYDDFVIITENDFIKNLNNLPLIFSSKYFQLAHEGAFRPITTITYFFDYFAWKLNVSGWRLTNLIFLCTSAVLVFFLAAKILKDRSFALLTALFFIVHPVHSETINFITCREDLLCGSFLLLSFLLYIKYLNGKNRYLYYLSLFSLVLSLFTKEMGIILLPIIFLYDECFLSGEAKTKRLSRYSGFLLISALFLLGRFFIFKPAGYLTGVDLSQIRPYPGGNIFFTFLTFIKITAYYLKLLILPLNLTVDYSWFPVISSLRDYSLYVPVIIIGIILFLTFRARKYSREIFFSSIYFFIALIPVSNIVPFWTLLAERYLLIPSFGFFLFLGILFLKVYRKIERVKPNNFFKTGLLLLMASLLVFYGIRTFIRNYDWRNSKILWGKSLKFHPTVNAYTNLATAYKRQGDFGQAIKIYKIAIDIDPVFEINYYNLGEIYFENKEYNTAIQYFEKTIEINPNFTAAFYYLGNIYRHTGEEKLAKKYLEQAAILTPEYAESESDSTAILKNNDLSGIKTASEYCSLGVSFYKKGDWKKSIKYLKKGIEIDPDSAECYYNLGLFYSLKGDIKNGILNLEKAVRINPQFLLARYNLGILYAKKEYYNKAISEFKEVIDMEPENVNALYYLGLIYLKQNKYDAAREKFARILEINPEHILSRKKYDEIKK
jgi:tetratricopeptide (TPR) repeat protein